MTDFFVSYDSDNLSITAQELAISLKIVDDKSGFAWGNIQLKGPDNKEKSLGIGKYLETDSGSDIYKIIVTPTLLDWKEGEWNITSITTTDNAGNTSKYDSKWFSENNIGTALYNGVGEEFAPEWVKDSYYKYNNDFNNDYWKEKSPLLPPPSIDSISILDDGALSNGEGGKITFLVTGKNIKSTDSGSNTSINIGLNDKSTWAWLNLNLNYESLSSGNDSDGAYIFSADISKYTQGGNYSISNIWASNSGYDKNGNWKNNNISYSNWDEWKPEKTKETYDWGTTYNAEINANIKNLSLNFTSKIKDVYNPDINSLDFKILSLAETSKEFYQAYESIYTAFLKIFKDSESTAKYSSLINSFNLQSIYNKLAEPEDVSFIETSIDAFDDSSGIDQIWLNYKNEFSTNSFSFNYDSKYPSQYSNLILESDIKAVWAQWAESFSQIGFQLNAAINEIESKYTPNQNWYYLDTSAYQDISKLSNFVGWDTNPQLKAVVNKSTATNTSVKFIAPLSKYAPDGKWYVDALSVNDKSGKGNYYQKDAFSIEGWNYQDKLVNPNSDTEAPTLDMVSIQTKLDSLKVSSKQGKTSISLSSNATVMTWLKDLQNYNGDGQWTSYEEYQMEKEYVYKAIEWKDIDLSSIQTFDDNGGYLDWQYVDLSSLLSVKKNQKYANKIEWWSVSLDQFNDIEWNSKLFKKAFKNTSANLNILLNSDYFNSLKNSPKEVGKFYKSIYWNNFGGLYSKTYENIDWAYFSPSKWDNWIYKDLNLNKVQFDEFSDKTYKVFNWNLISLSSINNKTASAIDWNKVDYKKLFSDYQDGNLGMPVKEFNASDFSKISFEKMNSKNIKNLAKQMVKFVDTSVASVINVKSGSSIQSNEQFEVFMVKGKADIQIDLSSDSGIGDLVVLSKKSDNVLITGFDGDKDSISFSDLNPGSSGINFQSSNSGLEIQFNSKVLATLVGVNEL